MQDMAGDRALAIGNVIALVDAGAVLVGILALGFSVVGVVAVWRTGKKGAIAYFHMFERLQVLQLLTVMLVIASATVLALLGLLDSNGITGILSGVAGYVLGGLNTGANVRPEVPASRDTAPAASAATPDGPPPGSTPADPPPA